MDSKPAKVTCIAPVNIAVIKYWGKRNEELILPINGSLSVTLDHSQLRAKTSIMASPDFTEDCMWLNGEKQPISNQRLQNVIKEMRRRAGKRKQSGSDPVGIFKWKLHICSENNFPTAAGLASSAAGYACLVAALSSLYGVHGDVSAVARQGSGSACRSMYGGFVEWTMGDEQHGDDSIAKQVAAQDHWPQLRVLILVVSGKKKPIGSTAGMQTSVTTSKLLRYRAVNTVPGRLDKMKKAIHDRDFSTFAQLTMKDSNEMHACCLDTYPPISYMQDTSRDIQRLIHAINAHYGTEKVCYTYDAGPNACLYLLEENVAMVTQFVKHFFPPETNGGEFLRGLPVESFPLNEDALASIPLPVSPASIQYIISTKVGSGPTVISESESLLTSKGMPKSTV